MEEKLAREKLFNIVVGIIVDQLGMPSEEITPEASLKDDLEADSLDIVELVMKFEEVFRLEIPEEAVEGIETVGQIIDYLATRVDQTILQSIA